jgi:hypothetical protein
MRATLIGALGVMGALGAMAGVAQAAPDPAALAFKLPAQIEWKGDPEKGSLGYVLWGDPTKPGPYAILVKWPPH